MYYHPNYRLSDPELLAKYGLKPYSNREAISLQAVILYCFKNDYDFHLNDDEAQQLEFFHELMDTLPDHVRDILNVNMCQPHRFYDSEIVWSVYNKLRNVTQKELSTIYSHLLVALIQTSEPFITNGCYDYKQTKFLSQALAYCNSADVRFDDSKYPFLRILLPTFTDPILRNGGIYETDELYRFLIDEINGGIRIKDSDNIDMNEEWDLWGYGDMYEVEWDDYMDDLGTSSIEILDPKEFNQNFIRCLDRYEGADQIWVPYLNEWQQSSVKTREIQSCIDEGLLEQVITDGDKSILIMSTGWKHSSISFRKYDYEGLVGYPGISRSISYDEIKENDYSLNPKIYVDIDCDEDSEVVSLGDICELDIVGNPYDVCDDLAHNTPKSYHLLPDYHFCRSLDEVYINAEDVSYYGIEPLDVIDGDRMLYKGPHIHISEEGGYVLNTTAGYYLCPKKTNWALRVKDDCVSLEYLAYALFNSQSFKEFISTSPSSDMLMKRKVAILKDKMKQSDVVADFKDKYLPVVSSSNVYKVALLVPECVCDVKLSMDLLWYLQLQEFEHIKGEGGLLDLVDKGQVSFDAIIVDAEVDSLRGRYKGLRDLLSRYREGDVPVYLYTDVDDESLQDDLSEEEYRYVVGGRLFRRKEDSSIDRLVRNLRSELDRTNNHIAKIRGQYVREFEAASWIDKMFPHLHILLDLEYCLAHPDDSLLKVRPILNGLYEIIMSKISNGSGLDKVQSHGMLPSLLRDGKFDNKNNNQIFIIRGSVMPLPLAISLRFASDIANGEMHTENRKMDIRGYHSLVRSDNLAHAVIRILMDFILWLYEERFEFDGFCESRDSNILESVQLTGILQQADSDEYYCDTDRGRIHVIVPKGKVKVGAEINISQVKFETKYHDKYELVAQVNAWAYRKESK